MYYSIRTLLRGGILPLGKMVIAIFVVATPLLASAQATPKNDTVQKPLLDVLKKLKVSGTIRMRYTSSFHDNVDVNGAHYAPDATQEYTTNAFTLPQVRVVISGDVTDRLDVYFRANFADFSVNPQNRVLEYAYATYRITNSLDVRAGLFRPEFGREDDIATDFLQSFDYTNQYNAFTDNGWMSYQIGVSLLGKLKLSDIPITYAVGIFNGNGREGFTDNDNGKQFPARVTAQVVQGLEIGLNGGLGKARGNNVYAWGADLNYEKKLSDRFDIAVLTEYKEGSNQSLFFNQTVPGPAFDDYRIRGVYVLPSLHYRIYKKHIKGLEASFKYEYLDPSYKLGGNIRQQYVPMLGVDFAEKYAIRFQIGMLIDQYEDNIEGSTQFSASRFITQLQIRF